MELSQPTLNLLPAWLLQRARMLLRWLLGRANRSTLIGSAIAFALALTAALSALRDEGLPDLQEIEQADARKATFFGFLRPIVVANNQEISADRDKLLTIARQYAADGRISLLDELWLERLARDYRVDTGDKTLAETIAELKLRVDIVPVPLVLVQAAKESGWGTSRFAREANNLFGEWCYREGCGLVPKRRPAGASHEVRTFASIGRSVEAYLRNINSGNSYGRLRQIRANLRGSGEKITGAALADGLLFYSQRRQAYVEEVKSMLRQYHAFVEEQNP